MEIVSDPRKESLCDSSLEVGSPAAVRTVAGEGVRVRNDNGGAAVRSLKSTARARSDHRIAQSQGENFDPGDRSVSCLQSPMSSFAGGGDQGGTAEDPAHPKPVDGDVPVATQAEVTDRTLALVPAATKQKETMVQSEQTQDQEMDAHVNTGPEKFVDGEIQNQEEDIIDINLDEEVTPAAHQWRILARFYSMRRANPDNLLPEFRRIWQLRADMKFTVIDDNLYVLTFEVEGDYNHILRGGPWALRGELMLVAAVDGMIPLMEIAFTSLAIWARIYKIPPNMQSERIGRSMGSLLGTVREVDVDVKEQGVGDFLRIRVEIPLQKPLKDEVSVRIQGQIRTFKVRYERLPDFCFFCGIIGHAKGDCMKVQSGEKSRSLDSRLRCSPMRKSDRKAGVIRAESSARRNLMLPFGATAPTTRSYANSSNGVVPDKQKSKVDLAAEEELSSKVSEMQVSEGNQEQETPKTAVKDLAKTWEGGQNLKTKPPGSAPYRRTVRSGAGGSASAPTSADMIPALKEIRDGVQFSGNESSSATASVSAQNHGRKRTADEKEEIPMDTTTNNLPLVPYSEPVTGGATKKGKMDGEDNQVREVDVEAVSPGATDKLTGPNVAPRQE